MLKKRYIYDWKQMWYKKCWNENKNLADVEKLIIYFLITKHGN